MATPALDRFLAQLDAFRRALDTAQNPPSGDAEAALHGPGALLGHRLYTANGRTPVFMLQGLARVHRKLDFGAETPPTEVFDRVRLEAKIVEDVLGKVDFWWVLAGKAKAYKLPAAVVAWASQQHVEACGETLTWLRAREWMPHRYLDLADPLAFEPRADRLARRLRKLRWPTPKKLSVALRELLIDELREADDTLEALDLGDLEHGLHEARRQIRWFSVYASAMAGAVALDPAAEAPAGWERYLTPAIVESPYNKLPVPTSDDRPIVIPAYLFYALSYLIDALGRVKDRAQVTEAFAAGLAATGAGKGRSAESYLGDDALTPEAAGDAATELMEQVLGEDALLTRLADALED